MNHDPRAYTITIQKVQIDGDDYFESTIKELPDVAEYGKTYQEVYKLAIDTIETTAVMLEEAGREMPDPMIKHDEFSGRVTLRMAKSLHARVTAYSGYEGVSVNHLINIAIEQYITSSVTTSSLAADAFFRNEQSITRSDLMIRVLSNTADEKKDYDSTNTAYEDFQKFTSSPLALLTQFDEVGKLKLRRS